MKRLIIGITGSFGTGKSTVAGYFKSFGAELIDADKIAHKLLKSDKVVFKKLVLLFGKGILDKNNLINRFRLAKIVFDDNKLLGSLNRILHPKIVKIIKKEIQGSAKKTIILDAPLLFEAKLTSLVDKVIVVRTNKQTQIERLLLKAALTKKDILKRISAQIPLSEKARLADFVIDNNGPLTQTKKQVERLRRILWKN